MSGHESEKRQKPIPQDAVGVACCAVNELGCALEVYAVGGYRRTAELLQGKSLKSVNWRFLVVLKAPCFKTIYFVLIRTKFFKFFKSSGRSAFLHHTKVSVV